MTDRDRQPNIGSEASGSLRSEAPETSSSRHPMSHVRARIIDAADKAAHRWDNEYMTCGRDSCIAQAAASTALVILREQLHDHPHYRRGGTNFDEPLKLIKALLADLLVERPPRQESEQKEDHGGTSLTEGDGVSVSVPTGQLSHAVLAKALRLYRLLPGRYPDPTIEIESETCIGFDWDEGSARVLAISVDERAGIGYAYLVGESRGHGRTHDSEAIAFIDEILRSIYGSAPRPICGEASGVGVGLYFCQRTQGHAGWHSPLPDGHADD